MTRDEGRVKFVLIAAVLIAVISGPALPGSLTGSAIACPALPQAASPSAVLASSDEDYRIGAGDVIEITIDKAAELSGNFRVRSDGSIIMNYLGTVVVQKKTRYELAKEIEDSLRGRYLTEPHVAVDVKQYNSRAFFIQGSVRNPGLYHMEGRPSLLKLITIAGGLTQNYGATAFIIREAKRNGTGQAGDSGGDGLTDPAPSKPSSNGEGRPADEPEGEGGEEPDSNYTLLRANISRLLMGNFEHDVVIEPGDIINIPPSDVFFIGGEVQAPGSFPLTPGTTLRQAIALAQGVNFEAAKSRSIIFRENQANGQQEEIRVDLGAVMNGKSEDIKIMANDVIIVPNSRLKSISGTFLRAFGLGLFRRGPIPGRRF